MGSFWDDYYKAVEDITKEVNDRAVSYARYKVQEDFNTELIKEVAKKTGHKNLATTVFVDVSLESDDSLKVHFYNDASWIEGDYHSNSSFHQSGGKWSSVSEHYGLSKDDFWDMKFNEGYGGDAHGTVDSDWLADNFWDGIIYYTNGWPRGAAEYLYVGKRHEKSAESVMDEYVKKYISNGRYQRYIMEAISMMSN